MDHVAAINKMPLGGFPFPCLRVNSCFNLQCPDKHVNTPASVLSAHGQDDAGPGGRDLRRDGGAPRGPVPRGAVGGGQGADPRRRHSRPVEAGPGARVRLCV